MDQDAIVIGGGVAGLSAATWLARYRRRVLVLDGEQPRNRWVEQAHGYLGMEPVAPSTLRQRALDQLARYADATVVCEPVTSVAVKGGDGFIASTGGRTLSARRLVLATGVADVFPDVEGFFTHYGESVFHCPTCDGYEARDQRVVVFGWHEDIAGFALTLLDWAADVVIVTQGQKFEGDAAHRAALDRHGIRIIEDRAVALRGPRGDLRSAVLQTAEELPCRLAFFSITHRPVTGLAEQLGCALDDSGYVVVDEHGQTSVEGVYAAGDVTPGVQLLQVAAAKGTVAGVSCALSLRGDPGSNAAAPSVEDELGRG